MPRYMLHGVLARAPAIHIMLCQLKRSAGLSLDCQMSCKPMEKSAWGRYSEMGDHLGVAHVESCRAICLSETSNLTVEFAELLWPTTIHPQPFRAQELHT